MITANQIKDFKGPCYEHTAGYVYAYPHALLRPYILHYAVSDPSDIAEEYTVLPSVSSTMIFQINPDESIQSGLRAVNTKPCLVGGIARQAKLLVLVEFRTGCLYPFLRAEQSELRDRYYNLDDLDRDLKESVERACYKAKDLEDLFSQLDCIFLTHYNAYDAGDCLAALKKQIIHAKGNITIKELMANCYYSEKHIRRLFQNYIGASPKELARIVRVNYVMDQIVYSQTSLTDIAVESGYFDQAHLNKDIKDICDLTPHELQSKMSVFYKYDFDQ